MKRSFLLTLSLIILFSCNEKNNDCPQNNPPGFAEYFSCKINGEEFIPRGDFGCSRYTFSYSPQGGIGIDEGYFLVSGRDCPTLRSVSVRINNFQPLTGILNFVEPAHADSCFPLYRFNPLDGEILRFENLISGTMDINTMTPYDSKNQEPGRVEGTFEFTVANETNDSTITVTDGEFGFKVYAEW
jgi:hypothetical protein